MRVQAFAFMIFATAFGAVTASASLSKSQMNQLEDQIHQLVVEAHETHSFHGNIEVRIGQDVIYQNSLGIAVDEFDVPHTNKSRFMIASVSKSFTAAMIMILHEKGKINIDQPYSTYIPADDNFHPKTKELWNSFTIKDLLTHTSGTMRDVRFVELYNSEKYEPLLSAVFDNMAEGMNVFSLKRDGYARYSNMGYLMLAYLVEQTTNMNFHDALRIHIFNPLGMNSTGQFHRMFNVKYLVDGYNYIDDVDELRKRCCYDATSYVGSHSLYSDLNDLMLWLDDLFSGDSKILSQDSLDLMTTALAPFKYRTEQYGLGLFVDKINGHKRIWHDGFESGYLSLISTMPSLDLKIVVLGNRHKSEVYDGVLYSQNLNNQITELVTAELGKSHPDRN